MEKKTILIFAYYSYKDPIFQSAVLPYFANFPGNNKYRFILLTFEHETFVLSPKEMADSESHLIKQNIVWKRSKWRSGRYKKIKKLIDLVEGFCLASWLIFKYKAVGIYSEGFPGSIIGYYVALFTGKKHLIHTFEPHANYMVESGLWTNDSWETKVIRWHEHRIANQASYLFTATQLMIDRLGKEGVDTKKIFRVPSCVDLVHFKFSDPYREHIRKHFGIEKNEVVLVYLGKFGGMYMEDEAFEFFKLFQQETNGWVMILSPDDPDKIRGMANAHQLDNMHFIQGFVTRDEVPHYLSASDVAIVAVRQWLSKRFCSPIKTGEYLACGLPVIVPLGVSDDAEKIESLGIGFCLKELKKNDYLEVINKYKNSINTNGLEGVRNKARNYVLKDRSIESYQQLYYTLFENL
jgi:glycosyltransferase involved in cell wall biosynthesis